MSNNFANLDSLRHNSGHFPAWHALLTFAGGYHWIALLDLPFWTDCLFQRSSFTESLSLSHKKREALFTEFCFVPSPPRKRSVERGGFQSRAGSESGSRGCGSQGFLNMMDVQYCKRGEFQIIITQSRSFHGSRGCQCSKASRRGVGFKGGGFPYFDLSVPICPFVSLFVTLRFAWFPLGISPRFLWGFPDLSFPPSRPIASTYKEYSRTTTQSGPFPKKVGKTPGFQVYWIARCKSAMRCAFDFKVLDGIRNRDMCSKICVAENHLTTRSISLWWALLRRRSIAMEARARRALRVRCRYMVNFAVCPLSVKMNPLLFNPPFQDSEEKKQHKHELFGPDLPRTFLTLTPGCPWVKRFLPIIRAAEKRTSWCGRLQLWARTSMTRRVLEKIHAPPPQNRIGDQHRECKTGDGAYFAFFLGSDNSHITTPPPHKIPPDEEGLLWDGAWFAVP